MTKEQLSDLETAVRRMEADKKNFEVGAGIMDAAKNATNANIDEAILEDGEVLTVPEADDLEKYMFKQSFGGGTGYGVLCPSSTGMTKRLYFNSLKKRVVVYDATTKTPLSKNGSPVIIESKSNLTKAVRNCATMADIANMIAGKQIKFTAVKDENGNTRFHAAVRDANRIVTGTRETSVFAPEFV